MSSFARPLDTYVWVKRYWFVALTACLSYPDNPTDVIKKRYYDTHQNIFLFLPENDDIRKFYSYLTRFPITPYLDSRTSILQWLFFIHNQISDDCKVERRDRDELLREYYSAYIPVDTAKYNEYLFKRYFVGASIILGALITAIRL